MRRHQLWLAALAFVLFSAMPAARAEDQGAAAYIRSFYPPDDPKAPEARYTPRTAKLWDECRAQEEQTGDACMDFDMFVQGNDFELSDIKVEQVSGDAKQAVVRAQFKNFGKDETGDLQSRPRRPRLDDRRDHFRLQRAQRASAGQVHLHVAAKANWPDLSNAASTRRPSLPPTFPSSAQRSRP